MSTNDPEFYQAPKFTPEPPQALPKQRGCFFYGCIIATILALLMAIVLGVGALFRVSPTQPVGGPVHLHHAARASQGRHAAGAAPALKDRIEAFRNAVDAGTPTEPLVLSSDDLNALIDEDDDLKGKIHVRIEGDEVKGQVSIPLERLGPGMMRGRYLNGEADLKASLSDGVLIVTLDSIEVNGKRPPDEIMKGIREQNLAKDAYKNEKHAKMIRKLESLEVKDGKIILRVRAKGASASDSSAAKKDVPVEIVPPPKDAAPKSEPNKKAEEPKTDAPSPKKS